jgi:Tfp pilus assembly protein PilN
MLRTNLATRPFYNERAVHVVLGGIVLAAAFVLVTSGVRLSALFQERAALTAVAESNEQQADEIFNQTVTLHRGVGATELDLLVAATREANRLIDQRAFSWTDFLNQIEATLPDDVMLTSLRPNVADRVVGVQVGIISESVGATDRFIERLEGTGAFADILSREEEITDADLYRAVLVGRYVPLPVKGNDRATPKGVTQ